MESEWKYESINRKDLRASLRLTCLVPRGLSLGAFCRARYTCLLMKPSRSPRPGSMAHGQGSPSDTPSCPTYLFSWRANGTLWARKTLGGRSNRGMRRLTRGSLLILHHLPTDHPSFQVPTVLVAELKSVFPDTRICAPPDAPSYPFPGHSPEHQDYPAVQGVRALPGDPIGKQR